MLALTVATLHGLRAVANLVLALAAGAHEGIRAIIDVVTLLAAVATTHGTGVGAFLGEVTLLLADTALSIGTVLRLGALRLVVTGGNLRVRWMQLV